MRGRGCGDDALGCGGEWGCSGGTALAGQRWARVTAGLGVVGLGSGRLGRLGDGAAVAVGFGGEG